MACSWRADGTHGDTGLLTLDDLVSLVLDWRRPVKLFIETKHPVRYGALVESKVLALLHRFGIAAPASADLSRAVVMSFSAAAVWRIRRAAPMLPTVLLGETSRYLGGGAATTVGATAVGPSIATLRDHPELVDRAAAQGRALYCWTVDHYEDMQYCRDVGVAWVATHHPGRTKAWLQNGLTARARAALDRPFWLVADSAGGTGASDANDWNNLPAASLIPHHDRTRVTAGEPADRDGHGGGRPVQCPAEQRQIPDVVELVDGQRIGGRPGHRIPAPRVEPHRGTGGPMQQRGHELPLIDHPVQVGPRGGAGTHVPERVAAVEGLTACGQVDAGEGIVDRRLGAYGHPADGVHNAAKPPNPISA